MIYLPLVTIASRNLSRRKGAKRIGEVVTIKKEQWESFLKINEQLLKKCGELQQEVKRLTARNEYLERTLAESGIQFMKESRNEE